MRLIIKFDPLFTGSYDIVNKYSIQGFIYSMLLGSPYNKYHNLKGFKFFTFSDISPVSDFKHGSYKYLVISSPNSDLINTLFWQIKGRNKAIINGLEFEIKHVKRFRPKLPKAFTTGSPIVLYKDNLNNEYFSFRKHGDIDFFLNRLKENALKKYRAYYNEDIEFDENIFDRMVFRKEVAVNIYKKGTRFVIIGSVWKMLEKFEIKPEYRKFYNFIMDCGLGEKNSLGFGFINPVKFQ